MTTMNDIKGDALYYLLKGEPGARKSTHALTFPTPQYWFSVDKKMRALSLPMKHWGIDPLQITYDDYVSWSALEKKLYDFRIKCPFKTLIFDSITSIGDIINLQTQKDKSGQTTKGGEEAGKRIGGITVNTREDFNAEASAFIQLVDATKDIQSAFNVNIILIAHVVGVRTENDSGVTTQTRVLVTGGNKIARKIPVYCEEIYHFNARSAAIAGREPEFTVFTQNAGEDYARTTLPLAPSFQLKNRERLYNDYVLPAMQKLALK